MDASPDYAPGPSAIIRPSMFDGSWRPPREMPDSPQPGESLTGSGLLVKSEPRVWARLVLSIGRFSLRFALTVD